MVLFYTQPQPKILQDESFTRTYRENTLTPIAEQKLEFNSYYVAGVTDSLVYLGNSTGFTHGIVWNYHTNDTTHFIIKISNAPEQFASLLNGKFLISISLLVKGLVQVFIEG